MSSSLPGVASRLNEPTICIDQVQVRLGLFYPPAIRQRPPWNQKGSYGSGRPKSRFVSRSSSASYFSDPQVYANLRGTECAVLSPYGSPTTGITTNGRRLLKANQRIPLPHRRGENARVTAKSVEKYERQENQYTGSELAELNSLHGAAVYVEHVRLLGQGLSFAIQDMDKLAGCSPLAVKLSLWRVEAYFEVPVAMCSEAHLAESIHKILRKLFGEPSSRERSVRALHGKDYRDFFLIWAVHPRYINLRFTKDKRDFHVKAYLKGDRYRIEVQANNPRVDGVKSSKLTSLEDLIPLVNETAELLAQFLRKLYSKLDQELHRPTDAVQVEHNRHSLEQAVFRVCPRSRDNLQFHKFFEQAAQDDDTDYRQTQRLLGKNSLKKLRDAGCLVVIGKGLSGSAPPLRRPSQGVLRVAWENLEKAEKPAPRRKAHVELAASVSMLTRQLYASEESSGWPVEPFRTFLLEASGECSNIDMPGSSAASVIRLVPSMPHPWRPSGSRG